MPFTLSHVAAVLPVARSPLVASALVIGSMAPDIPYYAPLPPLATHTALGIVSIDPALGLAAFVVWHGLLARPAWLAAPVGVRARVPSTAVDGLRSRLAHPQTIGWVLLSLVLGSLTHVGWDEFTHRGRWGATHLAWLADQHGALPGYRWAQYASGVFGAIIIVAWLIHWWRTTRPAAVPPGLPMVATWSAASAVAALGVAGACWGAVTADGSAGSSDLPSVLFGAATHGMGVGTAVVVVLAVGWNAAQVRAARAR